MMDREWRFVGIGLIALLCLPLLSAAADIRLKNGTTLHGLFLVSSSLSERFIGATEMNQVGAGNGNIVVRLVGRVDNGWQRIHFPIQQRQILDAQQEAALTTTKPVVFDRFPKVIRNGNGMVSQFGSMRSVQPFDEWGRRSLEILTSKGAAPVIQAITEAHPDHVIVTSTNFHWNLGLPLKTIPVELLDKMLRRQIKPDDLAARFAMARFYTQAEYYPYAFNELEMILRDFPDTDKKDVITNAQTELMNYFGKEILRKLAKRQQAGQHKLAEAFAKELLKQKLTGSVKQDVEDYVRKYEEATQQIEKAKLLLGDWQGKLTDTDQVSRLQPIRSEINEQLSVETLPRLDAFLKAEADSQYEPGQRLGLAYSGWLLGPANAVPDLDQAMRVWDARRLVMDYLHTEDLSVQIELSEKLKKMEGFSPDKVLPNLISQLPPIIEGAEIEPGAETRVVTAADDQVSYWVKLPAEYTYHHQYPMVIALRPNHRPAQAALSAWAGEVNDPDLGHQRGYIVIAPEYAPNGTEEYSFGASVHKYVLDCLIDARKRFSVDSDRVFLAGHGMGGDAAFDIGVAHPDEFAGVLPLGGTAINYINYTWENGNYTSWYCVGRGYDTNGMRSDRSDQVYDKILQHGTKYDFMLVEYMGRNGDNLVDDLARLYDWMDLHSRRPQPRQFSVKALRKTDNRYFWLTATGLPRDFILPGPNEVSPMAISGHIIQPGNMINLKSQTKNYTLRLTADLIDFSKKLRIKVGDRQVYNDIPTPDADVMLKELQQRGDRTRLPLVVLNP